MKKYRKVFVAGTFDHFHLGHQYFLWSAHQLAEEMVIVVARDATVERIKKLTPTFTEDERLARIEQEQFPRTRVRLGRSDGRFLQTLLEESPDMIYVGFDQQFEPKKWHGSGDAVDSILSNLVVHTSGPYFPEFFKSSHFRGSGRKKS